MGFIRRIQHDWEESSNATAITYVSQQLVIGTYLKIISFIAIGTIGSSRCGLQGIFFSGWMDWRGLDLQDGNYWIRDLVFLDVWSWGDLNLRVVDQGSHQKKNWDETVRLTDWVDPPPP